MPALFVLVPVGFMLLLACLIAGMDTLEEKMAWRSSKRFIVRQVANSGVVREWTCARYTQNKDQIIFRQRNHKDTTIVSGTWHVEPYLCEIG